MARQKTVRAYRYPTGPGRVACRNCGVICRVSQGVQDKPTSAAIVECEMCWNHRHGIGYNGIPAPMAA